MTRARPDVLWPAGAALAAFALYVALAPAGVVGGGDAGEFTLVLAVGGVPHPPGYPLYALGGHAWVTLLHALGVGWERAASAWSALGGAVAVGLLFALAMRLAAANPRLDATARAATALVASGLLAFNAVWLRETMVAEVITWHLALLAATCLAAFTMLEALAARPDRACVARGALLWGLLCGAALSHRMTAVFFVVPLSALLILSTPRALRARGGVWLRLAAGLAAPFAAYGYVAWRAAHPARYQWPLLEPGLAGLLAHMRAEIFTFYIGGFAPRPDQQAELNAAVWPVLAPGLALLAWALLRAPAARTRHFAGALFATTAIQLGFTLQYGVPDPAAYFLPALLGVILGVAERLSSVADRLPSPAILAPAALALVLVAAPGVGRTLERRAELIAVDRAIRARWEAIPFERGIVLWTGDWFVRLRAYQILEGSKPDLYVESPAMLTWDPPRRAFRRRFGFDPLAGLELRTDADLSRIEGHIAARTELPVIDFERWTP